MYFVSSLDNGKCGVTDTKDGVEEFVTMHDLQRLYSLGVTILGVDFPNWEVHKVTYDEIPKEYLLRYVNKEIYKELRMLNNKKITDIIEAYDTYTCKSEDTPSINELPWNNPKAIADLGIHFYGWGVYHIDWNGSAYFVSCSKVDAFAFEDSLRDWIASGVITVLEVLRCENVEIKYR